jgi:hypothetical protein
MDDTIVRRNIRRCLHIERNDVLAFVSEAANTVTNRSSSANVLHHMLHGYRCYTTC